MIYPSLRLNFANQTGHEVAATVFAQGETCRIGYTMKRADGTFKAGVAEYQADEEGERINAKHVIFKNNVTADEADALIKVHTKGFKKLDVDPAQDGIKVSIPACEEPEADFHEAPTDIPGPADP